jgi:hypothetical protein
MRPRAGAERFRRGLQILTPSGKGSRFRETGPYGTQVLAGPARCNLKGNHGGPLHRDLSLSLLASTAPMARPDGEMLMPLDSAPQGLLNDLRIAVEQRQQDVGRSLRRAAALLPIADRTHRHPNAAGELRL